MKLSHLATIFAILSVIGLGDASYLTMEHVRGAVPLCIGVSGCAVVTTSSYSSIAGIPVAILGALFYLAIFIGTIAYFDTKNSKILRYTARLTPLGFLFSLWFLYVQAFILHAFCTWCLLSATTSTLLFITGICIERHHRTFKEKIDELI